MLLLLDIGNTHTHIGLADDARVLRQKDIPTAGLLQGRAGSGLGAFTGRANIHGAAICSVVPDATPKAERLIRSLWHMHPLVLTAGTAVGIGISYPRPSSIGPDRLANAIALRHHYGAPAVAVDFGTAVTFDVVDRQGCYVGGIIAPGLSAMTDYLHEKTALLPRVTIRDTASVIGRSTREAMLIGAVHGYRGLIRGLVGELRRELGKRRLPVVATGGCASLIARGLPEITAVSPQLTLEGLRLFWGHSQKRSGAKRV